VSVPTTTAKVEAPASKSIFGNKSKSRESSVKPEEPSKGKVSLYILHGVDVKAD